MEKNFLFDSEEKIHNIPSRTDSSQSSNEDWIFEKYKSGLVSTDAPFQLFETNHSVSVEEESSDQTGTNRRSRGPYRKYTLQEKMMAVEKIQRGEDVKQVSRQYGIPRRNLLRWRKNGCERKQGGGRPTDEQMETQLKQRVKNKQETKQLFLANHHLLRHPKDGTLNSVEDSKFQQMDNLKPYALEFLSLERTNQYSQLN